MKSTSLTFVTDNADVEAVATGVAKQPTATRKGRVRKTAGTPRVALAVKKKKEPKPPRNPFRRSETSKLQLKQLQMGKRVETMSPRVEILRKRLDIMQTRLDFVTGKLKLVKEELTTRSEATTSETNTGSRSDGVCVDTTHEECADGDYSDDDTENIELDDEVQEGMDVDERAIEHAIN
jgi:hypothetical protein